MSCEPSIHISIGLVDECVIPSGVLRGEVIVVVHPSAKNGVRYRRVRLELKGVEHNGVRDDQGEFDALLDSYTSDRTYLSRHVTLSGKKKPSEDVETALQRRQEVMFRQHHTSPYFRVVPEKPQEPKAPKRVKAKNPADRAQPPPENTAPAATTVNTPPPPSSSAESPVPPSTTPATPYAGRRAEADAVNGNHADEVELQAASTPRNRSVAADEPATIDHPRELRNGGGTDDDNTDNDSEDVVVPQGTAGNVGAPRSSVAPTESAAASATTVVQPPTVAALAPMEMEEEVAPDESETYRRRLREQRLMPGRYTFPFSFRVPPWMPPSLYYSIDDASGHITYTAKASVEFGRGRRDQTAHKRFYVLSAISRRQLIACHEEAVEAATTSPLPPLSALFQVFACSCLGNMCCLASHSAVEVEVALQCSRALVLSDANATYQVFREYQATRDELEQEELERGLPVLDPADPPNRSAKNAGPHPSTLPVNGYDAFNERKYVPRDEDDDDDIAGIAPSAPLMGKERSNAVPAAGTEGTDSGTKDDGTLKKQPLLDDCGADGIVDVLETPAISRKEARRQAKREAMRLRRLEVERSLPLPIGVLPLIVRVRNACQKREISRVRVELRESVRVFKSLEMPRVFAHPLARYDYTVSIPPGDEVTFAARLSLPKQFRRRREDDSSLMPPPGVKTANITTATFIAVSFPGLTTYVEEEDWVNSVVQLAEAVDMSDDVLDLPTRYS